MARSFHGTGEQAIAWALDNADEVDSFLRVWQQGDAEAEWPEFYEWLGKQPAKTGEDSDLAAALGEHAFKAGYDAGANAQRKKDLWGAAYVDAKEAAWPEYDPPEELKGRAF